MATPTIDPTKPCEAAAALRLVLMQAMAGGQVVSVEFWTDGGTRRRVEYKPASLDLLRSEITRFENECARLSGRTRRYAIRGG